MRTLRTLSLAKHYIQGRNLSAFPVRAVNEVLLGPAARVRVEWSLLVARFIS